MTMFTDEHLPDEDEDVNDIWDFVTVVCTGCDEEYNLPENVVRCPFCNSVLGVCSDETALDTRCLDD